MDRWRLLSVTLLSPTLSLVCVCVCAIVVADDTAYVAVDAVVVAVDAQQTHTHALFCKDF